MEPEVEPKNVLAIKLLAKVVYVMTKNKSGYQWSISDEYVGSLQTLLKLNNEEYQHVLNISGLLTRQLNERLNAVQLLVEYIRKEGTYCSYSYNRELADKNKKRKRMVMLLKIHDDHKKWIWEYDKHPTSANKTTIEEVKNEYCNFLHKFPTY